MRKRLILAAAAGLLLSTATFGAATTSANGPAVDPGPPPDLHCPDHDAAFPEGLGKGASLLDDESVSGASITLEAGTEFCVKAATDHSGKLTSSGASYTVTWLNNGGQTPGISYYVIYSRPTPPTPEAFVRVTPLCVGPGVYGLDDETIVVPDGQYLMRVRHESGPGPLGYNLQVAGNVIVGGLSIEAGETQGHLIPAGTNGVKAVPTGDWKNTYGGTGSTSQKPCDTPPPPATQVSPVDPVVVQAVCTDDGSLTTPSVTATNTANISYEVIGTIAAGETVTVRATLVGDNVEWGSATGWIANGDALEFTVNLAAPTCETPVTDVSPVDPVVVQAVCTDNGSLTTPSVTATNTANISYEVIGTIAAGETVTVRATLVGDNVEWGSAPGWIANGDALEFTVNLAAPSCETPEFVISPLPTPEFTPPPVPEQLPPPGVAQPQPGIPAAPATPAPDVEAAPPPGPAPQTPAPAPSSLPRTGAASWAMAALATALLGAGVGMRRIGREV